ncbi:hypothetical protein EVAR_38970_1 [Eumeta japonica]|uniref:Uncharacterized protein n=1 Tax=Eumeta variegata TaxID=151549 RepID=A0A4C1W7M6_EUMVA|nr:hypothetical protein EVAR_38970_1 [Eumeta japonica]
MICTTTSVVQIMINQNPLSSQMLRFESKHNSVFLVFIAIAASCINKSRRCARSTRSATPCAALAAARAASPSAGPACAADAPAGGGSLPHDGHLSDLLWPVMHHRLCTLVNLELCT